MIPSWLGHIIEAAVMAVVVGGIMSVSLFDVEAAIAGIMFSIGHFHGREKRDVENKLNMPPPHLKAYWFGYWHEKSLIDFWPVAGIGLGIIYWLTK